MKSTSNTREVLIAVQADKGYYLYEGMGILPESFQWIKWLRLSMQQHMGYGDWIMNQVFEDVMHNNKFLPQYVNCVKREDIAQGVTILEFE